MKLSKSTLLTAAFVATSLVASPAEAKFTRNSATECQVCTSGCLTGTALLLGGYWFLSGSTSRILSCPVTDETDFGKGEVEDINVHVLDNSNTEPVTAQFCVVDPFALSMNCDTADSSGNATTGLVTLSLDGTLIDYGTAAARNAWFAHILVTLNGNGDEMRGYFVSDIES